MNPMLTKLGAWIAKTRAEQNIPAPAIRAARLQLLNLIAAVNASAGIPEIRSLFDALPIGAGPSTSLTSGSKMGVADAAYVNACFSMAEDYDDILWMGHTGHSTVFAALAVAESKGASFQDLLSAIVVANEIAGRLGASSLFGPLNGQMWTFIHLVGAAAASAYLLELDANQSTHALAISLSQPPFALQPGFFGPTSKFLTAATPTHTGVMAAYLARNGMTGAPAILEKGFWDTFTFEALPKVFDDLGTAWVIESLSIKTYPVCHYYQTACEATETLHQKRPVTLDEVRRVVCKTTLPAQEVLQLASKYANGVPDLSPIGVSFDLSLALAIVLQAGKLTPNEASNPWLAAHSKEILSWRQKIQIKHDPNLSLRILDSADGIPAGRETLHSLGLFDWLRIAKGFYKFGVRVPLRDVFPWIGALLRRLFKKKAPAVIKWDTIPLYFPNSIMIERTDGTKDTMRIDLPNGSLARDGMEDRLKDKFLRALSPRLGDAGALNVYNAGMSNTITVTDLVNKVTQ